MIDTRILASAAALACGLAFIVAPACAGSADYRFELAGKPVLSGQTDIVQVRLVHVPDGKPVAAVDGYAEILAKVREYAKGSPKVTADIAKEWMAKE